MTTVAQFPELIACECLGLGSHVTKVDRSSLAYWLLIRVQKVKATVPIYSGDVEEGIPLVDSIRETRKDNEDIRFSTRSNDLNDHDTFCRINRGVRRGVCISAALRCFHCHSTSTGKNCHRSNSGQRQSRNTIEECS